MVCATNTKARVGLARRCHRRFDPRSRYFSLSSTSKFSSLSSKCILIYLFALFVQLPFSSLSCDGSSWLPLPLVSFPSFSLLPTPNRPGQSERSLEARHEADSFFDPAEWSERLTLGQSGWLGAATVGSIPALAISLFLQRLNFFSFFKVYIYLFALFVKLPFSSLSCAGSSCLPLLLVSFPSFSLLPTPIDRVSLNVALKLVTKPSLF